MLQDHYIEKKNLFDEWRKRNIFEECIWSHNKVDKNHTSFDQSIALCGAIIEHWKFSVGGTLQQKQEQQTSSER